jgi:flagellar protein FlaF
MSVERHNAYKAHQHEQETPRDTEARALLGCARRLEEACRPDAGMESYIHAIRHNQQLWTIFQVCLCEPDNALPRDLKILLLNLSRYVDKVSFRALTEYAPDQLKSLIDINRNIAAGLGVKAAAQAATTAPMAPPPSSGQVMTTA